MAKPKNYYYSSGPVQKPAPGTSSRKHWNQNVTRLPHQKEHFRDSSGEGNLATGLEGYTNIRAARGEGRMVKTFQESRGSRHGFNAWLGWGGHNISGKWVDKYEGATGAVDVVSSDINMLYDVYANSSDIQSAMDTAGGTTVLAFGIDPQDGADYSYEIEFRQKARHARNFREMMDLQYQHSSAFTNAYMDM